MRAKLETLVTLRINLTLRLQIIAIAVHGALVNERFKFGHYLVRKHHCIRANVVAKFLLSMGARNRNQREPLMQAPKDCKLGG
jgi:hypothetical protein